MYKVIEAELYEMFVGHGVTTAEIAGMSIDVIEGQIGELRDADFLPELSDREIAEIILCYAKDEE